MNTPKTAFIAIVGKANVGKSSILNKLLGTKIAIVSSKPQTTRTRIMGVLTTDDNIQLVFTDTPGFHKPKTKLGEKMVKAVSDSIDGVVVAANYNCPGQLVISGADEAVDAACVKLKEAGARRALRLPVGGAFHSPLMEAARAELEQAIAEVEFHTPTCPIYQNVDAMPQTEPEIIKANIIAQLTAPVRWTQIAKNMIADGYNNFTELGPGAVLQGMIKKVSTEVSVESKSNM